MPLKLPKVIGHRGAASYAPENTLESIHTAADVGAEWIELDVKLTKDMVPIIFHDEDLERTTNGSGLVAETTYEDIQQLEAGSWYADSFSGVKIPTLEEALEEIINRDLGLNLEIKPCPSREKDTTEAALDILSQIWDDHDRLLISSFQNICLEVARDMAPDWHYGYLIGGNSAEDLPDGWLDIADYLDVKTINLGTNIINEEVIRSVIDKDLIPLVYTVNDPSEARRFQAWGVQTFFSDEPDVILENLLTVH